MKSSDTIFALAFALFLGAPAFAQTPAPTAPAPTAPAAETPAPAAEGAAPAANGGVSMGEAVDDVGTTYVKETIEDWQVQCVRTGLEADPCQLYQLMKDGQGNSVAEINLFNLPAGGEAFAGASIITPLETLLTAQITMNVDTAAPKRYPFTLCAPMGCVSRVGYTEAEVNALRRGNKATFTIVPAMAPDQKVELTMSLKGFTKAFETVVAANVEADKAAEAAQKAASEAKPAAN